MMEKYGALGGIWFVVFAVIGALIAGSPPNRTDDLNDIAAWYSDNSGAIQVGALLGGISVIGIAWWFGSLWRAMVRAEEGSPRVAAIAAVGFILSGAMALSGFGINAAAASRIDQLGSGAAIFLDIANVSLGFAGIGTLIMVLAVSGLALRTGCLPKWAVWLGLVVVVAEAIAAIGIASDATFFSVFGLIAFLSWAVWMVATAVLLYQNAPAGD